MNSQHPLGAISAVLQHAARGLTGTLAVLTLSLSGCPEETPTCPVGSLDCACTAANTCDGALTCSEGTCSATPACEDGADGCACYANNTCDAGLDCNAGVCGAPAEGKLGDSCDATSPCGAHTDGTALECTEGTCQLPTSCDEGTLGCACDNGACASQGGVQLACQGGICVDPASCTAGEQGCACAAGDSCNSGLQCQGGLCVPETVVGAGISFGNAEVRSCSLVFELSDVSANFTDAVVGRSKRKDTRLSLSFIAVEDAALEGPVATLVGADGTAIDMTDVKPVVLECFDRKGVAVATPALDLN